MGIKGIGKLVNKVKNSIGKAVNAGKQAVKKATNSIKSKINNISKKVKNTVGNMVKATKSVTKNIINKAKNTVGNVAKVTKNVTKKAKETIKKVKDKGIKEVGKNVLNKLKNQMKEIKENGFFTVVKGKVITGAKNYLPKSINRFIRSLKQASKKIYGNNTFNNLLKEGINLGKKIGNTLDKAVNYLDKSFNQIIKGSYAGDETTLLGIVGEIGVGCIPVIGQIADFREVVYDFQNWEWKWSNAGDLLLDVIGFIPLIGDGIKAVKKIPFKEIGNGIKKGIKEIPNIWKSAKSNIGNIVSKFSKKGIQETAENLISTNMLKEMGDYLKKTLDDVINFNNNRQFNFAGIGNVDDDVLKNLDNNVKPISEEIKKTNVNNINKNNNNSVSGVEINSDIITDGSHLENGKLKSNVRYKTGEYDYIYETDSKGRICKFETNNLQFTSRKNRLSHDQKTPGKIKGDHAGHLAGDRFGGSPEIDNLVSQTSKNNLSNFKKLENEWARALAQNKKVEINIEIEYNGNINDYRPSKFIIEYTIDNNKKKITLNN